MVSPHGDWSQLDQTDPRVDGPVVIFCLSVQHTGTWTAISWLTAHDNVVGFLQEKHVNEVIAGKPIVHQIEEYSLKSSFDPLMVYHEHIRLEDERRFKSGFRPDLWWERNVAPSQMIFIGTHPTLIPIRDPLASLITYQKWGERDGRIGTSAFSPEAHINNWCGLAVGWENIKLFAHCRFLCWDLLNGSPLEIEEHLLGISESLGLQDPKPSADWSDGRLINTAGEYPLKSAYIDRNVGRVRKGLSEGGFDLLQGRESILRPFLEELGYSDLMWW